MSKPTSESQTIAEVIRAIVKGYGRGGLSYVAARLGMTPSAMLKRLKSPEPFDEPSLRAALLLMELKGSELPAKTEKRVGRFTIRTHETGDGIKPSWSQK